MVSSFLTLLVITLSQAIDIQKGIIQHQYSRTPWLTFVHDLNVHIESESESNVKKNEEFAIRGSVVYHQQNPMGCTPWSPYIGSEEDKPIGIVKRGECSFFDKIQNAQNANLKALIVVNTDDSIMIMGFDDKQLAEYREDHSDILLTMMAPSSFAEFLEGSSIAMQHSDILVTNYQPTIYDPVMIVGVFVATLLVAAGAWYSSDVERAKMQRSLRPTNGRSSGRTLRRRQEVEELDASAAWCFVVMASCGLLTMYFFVDYIFYGILCVFCFGATNGLSTVFSHLLDYAMPSLQREKLSIGLGYYSMTVSWSDFLGFVPAAMLTASWYFFRLTDWGWILQNIMCVGLLLLMQRTVRISNMKIAAILLSMAFFYDIFWVFLSPMIFESSPMIKVATYQHSHDSRDTLPVVLKFPRIDDPFHHPMVLGLGDIALPGLFVSYLLRFDYLSRVGMSLKRGYFVPALLGYMVGMAMTDINLILMASGQPALLFLVPWTLGLTCLLAWWRGEFKSLWQGFAQKEKKGSPTNGKFKSSSADFAAESRRPLIISAGSTLSE